MFNFLSFTTNKSVPDFAKQILFLCLLIPWSGLVLAEKPVPSTEAIKRELVEIMKSVNFVPQLGEDNPLCKTFYEDFKTQKHIEHLKPILKVDSYDDPALKPYRDQCPDFDFNRNLSASRATGWTEEEWEAMGTPTYGMSNFQLYRVDLDNNPKNGEELVFYHEGEKTIKQEIPYDGSPKIEKEYINPAARGYRTIDLKRCKGTIGGASFGRLGNAQWTRNGIIRYKNKNAIYALESFTNQPDYWYLELSTYSERLKRVAPTCSYHKPR